MIRHAVNGGEKEIVDSELGKVYHVDGFCKETNTVYEFYGCVCSTVVHCALTGKTIRSTMNGRCGDY